MIKNVNFIILHSCNLQIYFIHNNPAAQHLRSGVVFCLYGVRFFCREIRLLHIKPLNLSAILCIKSLKYFNLCDKIAFIGIAHGDTGMRAAEASRRLVLFLLLRGVLK